MILLHNSDRYAWEKLQFVVHFPCLQLVVTIVNSMRLLPFIAQDTFEMDSTVFLLVHLASVDATFHRKSPPGNNFCPNTRTLHHGG